MKVFREQAEYSLIINLKTNKDISKLESLLKEFLQKGLIFKHEAIIKQGKFHKLNLVPLPDIMDMKKKINNLGFKVRILKSEE